jgi:hypothetical protein
MLFDMEKNHWTRPVLIGRWGRVRTDRRLTHRGFDRVGLLNQPYGSDADICETRMKVRSGPFLIRCRGCEIRKEGQGPGLRRVRYERQLRAMCRYSLHTTRKSEVGVTIEARAAGRGGQLPGGNCGRYPRLGWRAREGPGLGQDGPKPGRPRLTRTDLPRRSRSRTRGCDRFSPMRSARPGSDSTAPSIMRSPASRPCRPRA